MFRLGLAFLLVAVPAVLRAENQPPLTTEKVFSEVLKGGQL